MAQPTAVILVVGLTRRLIGPDTPCIAAFAQKGTVRAVRPVLPAVTCSVQASILTGLSPGDETKKPGHGVVGNGWYEQESAEVRFWRQSNRLVHGEKVWETARRRDPSVTCANLFWWFNMVSSVDYSVTPRPIYKADGRKIPDVYTRPAELRDQLQNDLGRFPLFQFWGPGWSIRSSQWIAAASRAVYERYKPTLNLVYLPHLDYPLQQYGPGHDEIPKHLRAVDAVVGELIDFYTNRGVRVMLVSEYGIEAVEEAVAINRVLRREGFLQVREEEGLELLDPGASSAFAVADHQVAHVYVADRRDVAAVARLCGQTRGVERVLDGAGKRECQLDHGRAGDLVLIAQRGGWFTYDYWLNDDRAPNFARTVDIHRKPGYDPRELFLDPAIRFPKLTIARKLLLKKLGFRGLMDVIPLDTSLVRGSHGRVPDDPEEMPVVITELDGSLDQDGLSCCGVRDVVLEHLFRGD